MYERARESFWLPTEINVAADCLEWKTKLTDSERRVLIVVLAFFATADAVVADNLVERFAKEVPMMEAKYFYSFQAMM